LLDLTLPGDAAAAASASAPVAAPARSLTGPSLGTSTSATAPSTANTLRPLPATIGRYRVQRRLGEGSTSEVFLAHDPFREQAVAIKRVRADNADRLSGHFFAAEAALVGRLQHPNVVALLDAVHDEAEPYLVMEYVKGPTLRRFCRADALLPLAQIVEIGFKAAMALGYCWRQGLIHRDVKPANILAVVEDSGLGPEVRDIKISDFGSVFNLGAERTQVFRVGSLAYMSPEQLEGDALDCRADIYSLAAVLYHLVCGRPPFDAQQQAALMHQIFHATPPSPSGLREGVSEAFEALLLRALARHRNDRFADWEAFAQALSDLVAQREVPRDSAQSVLDSERFVLLRGLEFFREFGDVELWEVVHRARWKRYAMGTPLFKRGQQGNSFHILALGAVEVFRDGQQVAALQAGTSVGEMAYLAPNPELRAHSADVLVSAEATTIAFTPESMAGLSMATRARFDAAFIRVLVRRLHAAHEAMAHPRRIL
jgi:eukaryotic-like serine/threonine-protein kinase